MSTELTQRASRRAILTAAAGGAAALAASSLVKPFPAAAAAANMQTETDNATAAQTGVSNATADANALFGHASGAGSGIEGTSAVGVGVIGVSSDVSSPETNDRNTGVFGVAGDAAGVTWSTALTGVFGYSETVGTDFFATGVWGDSPDVGVYGSAGGVGVRGDGGQFGVLGQSWGPDTVGVVARANPAGDSADTAAVPERALLVQGRAEFTRSGRSYVSAGNASKSVNLAGCSTSTLVLAVLSTSRSGRYVRAVVPGSNSFRVYLNQGVSKRTYFTWIAFTNPSNHSG